MTARDAGHVEPLSDRIWGDEPLGRDELTYISGLIEADERAQARKAERRALALEAPLYWDVAHVVSAYDGDTATCALDLGWGHWLGDEEGGIKMRFYGIDAPEMRGSERPEGTKVRNWVRGLILDRMVLIKSHKMRRGVLPATGKYGRYLVELFPRSPHTGELFNLNQALVEEGMAELETYGQPFWGWSQVPAPVGKPLVRPTG